MTIHTVDVLIVGAGLSGIGAACHLKRDCPGKSFTVLERRHAIGGTWDLFRYPGIRSDSDMHTLGYNFKPWTDPQAIADGPAIREYIRETAREQGIEAHIRFGHRVMRAEWSSRDARWTVRVRIDGEDTDTLFHANFVIGCTGYYDYDAGYTPDFPGRADYQGTFIHPQHWPEGFDYSGKRVVVIGSGATAVTLVPTMAQQAAHVTMLQRSPSYILAIPRDDVMSSFLARFLPKAWVYRIARVRNILLSMALFKFSRAFPERMTRFLQSQIRKELGEGTDLRHFSPRYQPWDERLCMVPDGDLFQALKDNKAEMVTDTIDTFTAEGIRLASGRELAADVVVSATGLQLQVFGGTEVLVDGVPFDLQSKLCYKGVMFQDLPNMGIVLGYTNASWTLKADLTVEYLCRLMGHMDRTGARQVVPRNRDGSIEKMPLLDLNSGYIERAKDMLPHQGSRAPWRLRQNVMLDWMMLHFAQLDDGVLEFQGRAGTLAAEGSR